VLDAVNAHSLFELSLYMCDMLLRDTDQMSMAHSLEVREPLLDHVLVETLAGIHGRLKLEPGRQHSPKALLVDALPAELPRQIFRRAKMGFVFPWERWLRGELKNHISSLLEDTAGLEATGLHRQAVDSVWKAFLEGKPSVRYTDVLSLSHLLHWVGRHRLTAPSSGPERQPENGAAQLLPLGED
jgi:asparagine synthase (glutamine-hydrolysing)